MIVVDENLHSARFMDAVAAWYPGQVLSITQLRPTSVIKDDAVPGILRQQRQPTFLTINAFDFWRIAPPAPQYCIVAIEMSKERIAEVPSLLRLLFRTPEFRTKSARMNKVVRLTLQRLEYYSTDRRVH